MNSESCLMHFLDFKCDFRLMFVDITSLVMGISQREGDIPERQLQANYRHRIQESA